MICTIRRVARSYLTVSQWGGVGESVGLFFWGQQNDTTTSLVADYGLWFAPVTFMAGKLSHRVSKNNRLTYLVSDFRITHTIVASGFS